MWSEICRVLVDVHDPPDPPLVEPEVPLEEVLPDPPLVDPEVLWARACPRKSTEANTTKPNLEPLLKVLSFLLPANLKPGQCPDVLGKSRKRTRPVVPTWLPEESNAVISANSVLAGTICSAAAAGNSMRASAVVVFHNS